MFFFLIEVFYFILYNELYFRVKCSSVEYEVEIFKTNAQKLMVEFGFGRRFHDFKYFKVGFFFMFYEFIIYLRASS